MEAIAYGPLRELLRTQLLDDDDRRFVDYELSIQTRRFLSTKWFLFGFVVLAVSIRSASLLIGNQNEYLHFGLELFLNLFVVVGLYLGHVLAMPWLMRWAAWRIGRADQRFHLFVAALRAKERAVFGIRHLDTGASDRHYLAARDARLRCVRALRTAVVGSRRLAAAFPIGLPSVNEFRNEALTELADPEAPIRDEHLDVPSLNALWQYVYVQRSEALRDFALFHSGECLRLCDERQWWSLIRTARHSMMDLLRFAWAAAAFDVRVEHIEAAPKAQRVFNAKPDSIDIAAARLEYVQEKLAQLKAHPTTEARVNVIKLLAAVAAGLDDFPDEAEPKTQPKTEQTDEPEDPEAENDETETHSDESAKIGDEYEVYEADAGDNEDYQEGDFPGNIPIPDVAAPLRQPAVQAELQSILAARRRVDRDFQAEALSRRRGQPIAEIRAEMDVEYDEMLKKSTRQMPLRPGAQPTGMDQNELAAALRRRRAERPNVATLGDAESDSEK